MERFGATADLYSFVRPKRLRWPPRRRKSLKDSRENDRLTRVLVMVVVLSCSELLSNSQKFMFTRGQFVSVRDK